MKNSLFLDILSGKECSRPAVWYMRQAGRVLPSYNALKEKYTFKQMMEDPKLAAKVTLLPINDIGVDAAILFSDILVIPEALGMDLDFENKGPRFKTALKDVANPMQFLKDQPEKLDHVFAAIQEIIKTKEEHIPLIGFCGGPLTTLCYMFQGFSQNQNFPDFVPYLFKDKKLINSIVERMTDMCIYYIDGQIKAGIQAFQLFETHAGLIPVDLYNELFMPSVKRIFKFVRERSIKGIFLPKGLGIGLNKINQDVCDAISIDWQTPLTEARKLVGNDIIIQGNFDPRALLADKKGIEEEFQKCLEFGRNDKKYIFNLGHGLLPNIDVENVKHLTKLVKESDWS
ncbi:MAG: uroporphyrinogen decarboxylase [Marinifilaceae bacterium]|jgi:uroporphyrinogen decarboxylase|nr:uroporphyrinogen decarboxylase [Marinifilaceae bacterium]